MIIKKEEMSSRECDRKIQELQQRLNELYDEKGEIDEDMVRVSQEIDKLVVIETLRRTKMP